MSGFEHYQRELAALDHEIRHYAAVSGLSLERPGELQAYTQRPRENPAEEQVRDTLRGLLVLRIRLEAEMIELGYDVPPLVPPSLP